MTAARRDLQARQRATRTRLRSLGAQVEASYTDVFNGFGRVRADRVRRIARPKRHGGPAGARRAGQPADRQYLDVPRHVGRHGTHRSRRHDRHHRLGINYYHEDFGGAGTAAWLADDPTIREPGTFPTAKVVGRLDRGDDYDAERHATPGLTRTRWTARRAGPTSTSTAPTSRGRPPG
ncbi:MAG: hypothetical protein R3C32_05010 [Chloroflexota bacterium]